MPELKFSTGVVDYTINGVTVSFNPTDMTFIDKFASVFDKLTEMQRAHTTGADAEEGDNHGIGFYVWQDTEMRAIINELFKKDICTPLFGNVNVWALNEDDNLPLWFIVFSWLADQITESIKERGKGMPESIKKYTAKYHK